MYFCLCVLILALKIILPDHSRNPDTRSGQKNKQACTCSRKLFVCQRVYKLKRHSHTGKDVRRVYTKEKSLSMEKLAQKSLYFRGLFSITNSAILLLWSFFFIHIFKLLCFFVTL